MRTFCEISTLRKLDEDHFSFQPSKDWMQGRTLFGGVVGGAATRAILESVEDDERILRSLMVSFVAPVREGDVSIKTQILRKGKGITQIEARVTQDGQVCAVVQGVLGAPHEKSLHVAPLPGPCVKEEPSELPPMPYIEGMMPSFTQHVDYRWTIDSFSYSGAKEARCQGWVKFKDEHSVGLPEIVGLIDSWPPPVLSLADSFVPGSSVTWMVNFFQDWPAEGAHSEDWWLYDANCTATHDGYADTSACLWNQKGELVARSRQLVVEFSK